MELHAYEQMADALDATLKTERESNPRSVFPAVTPPGMAYVPFQQWGEVYEAEQGIRQGTMFPELDFPFKGGACSK